MILRKNTIALAAAAYTLLITSAAQGAVVISIIEVGSDVVVSGSGILNLNALTRNPVAQSGLSAMNPAFGLITTGDTGTTSRDRYGVVAGPAVWNALGSFRAPTSGTGDRFGIAGSSQFLIVPEFYVSGSQLNGSSTYENQTFASLGLVPGTHIYSWGTGGDADSLTVVIGVVPEPSSNLLLLASLCFFVARRRR